MIVGLSGTPASGKDTVAEILEKKGFSHFSLSQILRDFMREEGLEINIENLTSFGNKIGTKLVERALETIDPSHDTVISSIRQLEEIDILKKNKNFFMLFIDADARLRFERLKKRGRAGDSETFEQFIAIEAKQQGKSGVMNLAACREKSDFIIENNGTLQEFQNKVEDILRKIKEGN